MQRDLRTEFLTLHEFVAAARLKLDANGWDYLVGGAETETTLRRNRHALDTIALRPRVLRDVSDIDATASFLSKSSRLPVLLAPAAASQDQFRDYAERGNVFTQCVQALRRAA